MSLRRCMPGTLSYSDGATEGGVPMSLLPASPVPRGQRRARNDRTVRGLGTFQGEQRPRRSIPPRTTMEVEMTKIKSLLLGTAAGLLAVGGAQAADMPVKAAPVQYVKICSLYGDGFYYIPGTDTCLKMGGYVRVQAETTWVPAASRSAQRRQPGRQGRCTRDRPTTSTTASAGRSRGTCASRPNTARCAPTSASARRTPRRQHGWRHDLQPVLGSRVYPVCGLHGGPVAVVLRPLDLRRRLQLPQRARLGRHRRVRPEPLGLHRPVRQRLLRHAVAGRPRHPQGLDT